MKIGMNLLLWTDQPTFLKHESLVTRLKMWGFDGIEFPVSSMEASDIRAFSALCDHLGLGRTTILALDASLADPASRDPSLRRAAVNEIKKTAEQTKELGADLLVGPLFQGLGRFTGKAPAADEWCWAVDTIREAAECAARIGVRLALEPLNRFEMYLVNTMKDAEKFVEDVGLRNVGLLADTHHGNIEELNVAEAWSTVADNIFHVHISENHRGTPGSGHAVPPSIFSVLRRSGYTGWLTIETFGQNVPSLISRLHLWRTFADSEEETACRGLAYIRENLKK